MKGMMNSKGMTLIELVIVVTIIGILAVTLGFQFQGWVSGYRIENQIKEIYVDLVNTRARAMQRNRTHFIDLTTTQYNIYEDTNNNETYDAGTDLSVSQRDLETRYPVTFSAAGINFDTRGLSTNLEDKESICSNAPADANADNADYNCITISATRIKMGKLTTSISDGGACDTVAATAIANCVEK